MRRIQLVLAALAIVVTAFAAFAGPVMADSPDCRNARGDLIRCDGDLYAPYNNDGYYWNDYYAPYNNYWDDDYYGYNPYWYNDYYFADEGCPFWGDTSGAVNKWDCFD